MEVSDLLSLLKLLDNPLQDVPVLAVLRSPLVGLTINELATIRLTAKGPFWNALVRWHRKQTSSSSSATSSATSSSSSSASFSSSKSQDGIEAEEEQEAEGESSRITHHASLPHHASQIVSRFLNRFARWRRLARQASLSRCLEAILTETHYNEWLLTQSRGEQRQANVRRLFSLAQQFNQFQRQSLFRFLQFIDAQESAETEPEVGAGIQENAVRLMSIHQSKGLEFPVVVVADLAKPFNTSDLRAEVILDENYGLCPQIKPPHSGTRYPSLPYWLASESQRKEMLAEEMRLLYVAATRARDFLILSGNLSDAAFAKLWKRPAPESDPILAAQSYADWLSLWFFHTVGNNEFANRAGQNGLIRWQIHDDTRLLEGQAAPTQDGGRETLLATGTSSSLPEPDSAAWDDLQRRLSWIYPHRAATQQPAKASVTMLRRRAAEFADDESQTLFGAKTFPAHSPSLVTRHSSLDTGTAHHSFLQLVDLDHVASTAQLKAEAQRLAEENKLSAEAIALLDFEDLAAFWDSPLGRNVRANAAWIRRELAFTARFSAEELASVTRQESAPGLEQEDLVVQGVADLVVLQPREIWLIDFKTDRLKSHEVNDKVALYQPQLKLYSVALSRIYSRPVTGCWLYFLAARRAVQIKG
jgi:ATP-dependent helicase/nuclease subunit A